MKMYMVYKWFEFFFLALADMMASCAEVGMVATLKAEYMQDAQSDRTCIFLAFGSCWYDADRGADGHDL